MRATDFVESYFDAWNHRDPKAVADHLAADGIYCDIPENAQRTHDEVGIAQRQIEVDGFLQFVALHGFDVDMRTATFNPVVVEDLT